MVWQYRYFNRGRCFGQYIFYAAGRLWACQAAVPGKEVIFICLMLSMMIPGQLVLLPQYIMMARWDWSIRFLRLPFHIYLSPCLSLCPGSFFYGIPEELEEAARIDGLGRFGTYSGLSCQSQECWWQPSLFLILPVHGTHTWYLPRFISTQDKYVLVVGLQTVNNAHFQQENLTLAGVFLLHSLWLFSPCLHRGFSFRELPPQE